jgi:hypothetical protein
VQAPKQARRRDMFILSSAPAIEKKVVNLCSIQKQLITSVKESIGAFSRVYWFAKLFVGPIRKEDKTNEIMSNCTTKMIERCRVINDIDCHRHSFDIASDPSSRGACLLGALTSVLSPCSSNCDVFSSTSHTTKSRSKRRPAPTTTTYSELTILSGAKPTTTHIVLSAFHPDTE